MTNKDKARRLEIIARLSQLSSQGWSGARRCDWLKLEEELSALERAK